MPKTAISDREAPITTDDSRTYEKPLLMDILGIVILVNLIVLLSIILCA
jgi:hypothetical protein